MKDLPRVFPGKINDNINNTQEYFYGSDRSIIKKYDERTILTKINNIFSSSNHVYKSKVKITLNSDTLIEEIKSKTNSDLLTLNGKHIKIKDILEIEKVE